MLLWKSNGRGPRPSSGTCSELGLWCAPGGIRTPNRQIRRLVVFVHAVGLSTVCAAQIRGRIQLDRLSPVWCWLVD
jgi:hypothetical protein